MKKIAKKYEEEETSVQAIGFAIPSEEDEEDDDD